MSFSTKTLIHFIQSNSLCFSLGYKYSTDIQSIIGLSVFMGQLDN